MPKIKIIAAIGKNNELGKDGDLPAWTLATDMKRFKELTTGGVVVMGRKTFESFAKFNKNGVAKPLPNRTNVVVTRDKTWQSDGVTVCNSVEEVLEKFKESDTLWIIGGGEIYKQFLDRADELHITHVDTEVEADTFFPEFIRENYEVVTSEKVGESEKDSYVSEYKLYTKKH